MSRERLVSNISLEESKLCHKSPLRLRDQVYGNYVETTKDDEQPLEDDL